YRIFRSETARSPSAGGLDPVRRAIGERRPVWVADLAEAGFVRGEAAIVCRLKSGLIVPVFVGAEVAAILEFYSTKTEAIDLGLLETMSAVGMHLGRVVERERDQKALQELSLI